MTRLQQDPAQYQRGSLGLVKIVELDGLNAHRRIRVPIVERLARMTAGSERRQGQQGEYTMIRDENVPVKSPKTTRR